MCVKYQKCSLNLRLKRLQANNKLQHLSTFFSRPYSPREQNIGEQGTSYIVCLVRSRLTWVWKTENATASDSIAQGTMGIFSVGAKDAGKGEREKWDFPFPMIRSAKAIIAPVSLEWLSNPLFKMHLGTRQICCSSKQFRQKEKERRKALNVRLKTFI